MPIYNILNNSNEKNDTLVVTKSFGLDSKRCNVWLSPNRAAHCLENSRWAGGRISDVMALHGSVAAPCSFFLASIFLCTLSLTLRIRSNSHDYGWVLLLFLHALPRCQPLPNGVFSVLCLRQTISCCVLYELRTTSDSLGSCEETACVLLLGFHFVFPGQHC